MNIKKVVYSLIEINKFDLTIREDKFKQLLKTNSKEVKVIASIALNYRTLSNKNISYYNTNDMFLYYLYKIIKGSPLDTPNTLYHALTLIKNEILFTKNKLLKLLKVIYTKNELEVILINMLKELPIKEISYNKSSKLCYIFTTLRGNIKTNLQKEVLNKLHTLPSPNTVRVYEVSNKSLTFIGEGNKDFYYYLIGKIKVFPPYDWLSRNKTITYNKYHLLFKQFKFINIDTKEYQKVTVKPTDWLIGDNYEPIGVIVKYNNNKYEIKTNVKCPLDKLNIVLTINSKGTVTKFELIPLHNTNKET